MRRFSIRRICRTLPAGLLALLLTLSAAAVSPPGPEEDLLPAYQAAIGRLAILGFDQEQADTLWSRLGPELSGRLDREELSRQELELLALPFCREELLERCLAFWDGHPDRTAEEAAVTVNMGLDQEFYTQVDETPDPASEQVLVNKYQALPSTYVPRLKRLESRYGTGSLTPKAAGAFAAMADAARSEAGLSLRSVSAYRSYQTQVSLYQRYTVQNGQKLADTFSARAGHSEHQTGLALDINVARTSAHFERTKEYAWLVENCARFGFILRYPQDKMDITGYRFEPWHYRYVGEEVAGACMADGLTYEEYLARLAVPGTYAVPELPAPTAEWLALRREEGQRLLHTLLTV